MLKSEITIGLVYLAKVSGNVVPVCVTGESAFGGWHCLNVGTGRKVQVRSATRFLQEAAPLAATMHLQGWKSFNAVEMDVNTGEPTGRIETYLAPDRRRAAGFCFYTHHLSNGNVKLGMSGLTVIDGDKTWVVVVSK
jgi:FtsP/CotA-like multicopper oxidase with cupredoxin domain